MHVGLFEIVREKRAEREREETKRMAIKNHERSISFPSRSHPSTLAIEEGINKLLEREMTMSSMTSSGSICGNLSGLEELYKCTDELLNMGSTQRVLSEQRNRKFLEELLDGSLRLMDICNVLRDLMMETSENVRVFQSSVKRRRRGGGMDVEVVSGYIEFRKNMKRKTRKLLVSLKSFDNKNRNREAHDHGMIIQDHHHHLSAVIQAMRQVVSVSVTILSSFMELFLLGQNGSKKNKWSSVLKMLQRDHSEEISKKTKKRENELEIVDSAISCGENRPDVLNKNLEELERTVGKFEKNLEGLFRRLIRARASLLNIISQ